MDGGAVDPSSTTAPPTASALSGRFLRLADVEKLPPLTWLLRRLIPKGGVGALYGPEHVGKTAIVVSMARAMQAGLLDWMGLKLRQGNVAMLVAEGHSGIRNRMRAAAKVDNIPDADLNGMIVYQGADDLAAKVDDFIAGLTAEVAARGINSLDCIIVETISAYFLDGCSESEDAPTRAFVRALKRLAEAFGAAVIAVGHTGKEQARGMRMSSVFRCDVDFMIKVEGDEKSDLLKVSTRWPDGKMKDGAPIDLALRRRVVDVGADEDGEPVTSVTVTLADANDLSAFITPKPKRPSKRDRAVELLLDHVRQAGAVRPGDAQHAAGAESSFETGKRAWNGLVKEGRLVQDGETKMWRLGSTGQGQEHPDLT